MNCIAKGAITRLAAIGTGIPNPATRLGDVPLGRLGTPRDLADAICFLACEESSYLTGQILELGGGIQLGR